MAGQDTPLGAVDRKAEDARYPSMRGSARGSWMVTRILACLVDDPDEVFSADPIVKVKEPVPEE